MLVFNFNILKPCKKQELKGSWKFIWEIASIAMIQFTSPDQPRSMHLSFYHIQNETHFFH
jgi:hypothetical protein